MFYVFELDFKYMMKVEADGKFSIDNNSVDRNFEPRRIDRTMVEPPGASCEEKITRGKFCISISNFVHIFSHIL